MITARTRDPFRKRPRPTGIRDRTDAPPHPRSPYPSSASNPGRRWVSGEIEAPWAARTRSACDPPPTVVGLANQHFVDKGGDMFGWCGLCRRIPAQHRIVRPLIRRCARRREGCLAPGPQAETGSLSQRSQVPTQGAPMAQNASAESGLRAGAMGSTIPGKQTTAHGKTHCVLHAIPAWASHPLGQKRKDTDTASGTEAERAC